MRGKASCIWYSFAERGLRIASSVRMRALDPSSSLPDQQLIPSWVLAMSSGEMAIRYSASRSVASSRGRVNSNLESESLPASRIGEAGARRPYKTGKRSREITACLRRYRAPWNRCAEASAPVRPAAHRSGRNRIAKLGTIGAANVRFYETWIAPPVSTEGTSR